MAAPGGRRLFLDRWRGWRTWFVGFTQRNCAALSPRLHGADHAVGAIEHLVVERRVAHQAIMFDDRDDVGYSGRGATGPGVHFAVKNKVAEIEVATGAVIAYPFFSSRWFQTDLAHHLPGNDHSQHRHTLQWKLNDELPAP